MATENRISLTPVQWLICLIAAIGFAFDIYVLLMLPLIIKPALAALGGVAASGAPLLAPGSPEYVKWARTLFFVPALAGGIFGLIGGYLTDRLGRRRVLTFSILLYAFGALASGFATSLMQLLVSCANWLVMAGIIYTLLLQRVEYPAVLTALLAAAVAGVISHVPAGIGVLEAVFVALLSDQVAKEELLAVLLTYRGIYYLLPLMVAVVMYFLFEARMRRGKKAMAGPVS